MKSKTIILSNTEEHSGRGILTLYEEDDLLKCKLRLYNTPKLDKFCKLGIYHSNQVYSANLLEKSGVYETSFVGDFDLNLDFYTAIINTNENNKVIIAGGTYAGCCFEENSPQFEETNPTQTVENQNVEECKQDCKNCENCVYKKMFYEQNVENQSNIEEPKNENNAETNQNANIPTIMESILPQFNYIFENYTPDEELNNLLPNSKFVKMVEDNQQYSIGAIFDEEKIKLLCYATKCNYNTPAPQELGENYQWLPLDKEDPLSEGYYIVFQDAEDLKIVRF